MLGAAVFFGDREAGRLARGFIDSIFEDFHFVRRCYFISDLKALYCWKVTVFARPAGELGAVCGVRGDAKAKIHVICIRCWHW